MEEQADRAKACAEERLQALYSELADLIPEALAEDFVGMGYAKGKYYDSANPRILIVEKIPRPQAGIQKGDCNGQTACEESVGESSCCGDCGSGNGTVHAHLRTDEKDFTPVVGRIARHMLDGKGGEEWQEHIAWTYLYKLAPLRGNPDQYIYKKQKALCDKIIKAELEVLSPTHVLFLTGWGSVWDFDLPLSSLLKGDAVEGWGTTENGAKLIVTRYAVRKPEDKFAMDILEKIGLMEEFEEEGADR